AAAVPRTAPTKPTSPKKMRPMRVVVTSLVFPLQPSRHSCGWPVQRATAFERRRRRWDLRQLRACRLCKLLNFEKGREFRIQPWPVLSAVSISPPMRKAGSTPFNFPKTIDLARHRIRNGRPWTGGRSDDEGFTSPRHIDSWIRHGGPSGGIDDRVTVADGRIAGLDDRREARERGGVDLAWHPVRARRRPVQAQVRLRVSSGSGYSVEGALSSEDVQRSDDGR